MCITFIFTKNTGRDGSYELLGLVSDSKSEVGPDSRTSTGMSDGQSDILGQIEIIGVGRKSDKSRTEVGQITFGSRTDGHFFNLR